MKGNQIIQGLEVENRRLRKIIGQMEAERGQGKFLEELTCAALTGYTIREDLKPKECAAKALEAAEFVLELIMQKVRAAQAAEGDVENANEEEPTGDAEKSESGLILK